MLTLASSKGLKNLGPPVAIVAVLVVVTASLVAMCQSPTSPRGCAAPTGEASEALQEGSATSSTWTASLEDSRDFDGQLASYESMLYIETIDHPEEYVEVDYTRQLIALDAATGNERWSVGGRFEAIDRRAGILIYSDPAGLGLTGVEAETGQEVWSYRVPDYSAEPIIWSREVHAKLDPQSGTLVAYREHLGLFAGLNASSGSVLWMMSDPPVNIRDVQIADGVAFVDHYIFETTSSTQMIISAIRLATGGLLWSLPVPERSLINRDATLGPYHGQLISISLESPAFNTPYETSDGPYMLLALAAVTGLEMWRVDVGRYEYPLPEARVEFGSEGIYVSLAGQVSLLDPATGAIRWTFDTSPSFSMAERNRSHIAGLARPISEGVVIAGDSSLWRLDAATGGVAWMTPTGNQVVRDLVVVGDVLFAIGLRGHEDFAPESRVQAYHLQSGICLWSYRTDVFNVETWLSTSEKVFFATPDHVYAVHHGHLA